MYIGKRFLIMLTVIVAWLLVVIAPLLYLVDLFSHYAPYISFFDVTNAIILLTPVAWLVIYVTVTRILRGQQNDANRLARLEKLLETLDEDDLAAIQQHRQPQASSSHPDDFEDEDPRYDVLQDWLPAEKQKNR